jgi:hypothetical protein
MALHRVACTCTAHKDVKDFREGADVVDRGEGTVVASDVLALDALACELQEAHRREYYLRFY